MKMFNIIVPASSANIGPGFDSVGMAVKRYLTLQVEMQEQWIFEHDSPFLPADTNYEKHFIYLVARKIAKRHEKTLPPCKVVVKSEIPLARGLGSSASAVVAGIELANQLCDIQLTDVEKLQYATEIEGHPDNVSPALFGGLIITATSADGHVEYLKVPPLELDIVLYIPEVELKTAEARSVLPRELSRQQAATASGISNMMIASLLSGNFQLAGKMMEADQFHEPYRAKLIPNYDRIRAEARNLSAYGTVISGAGPTMISFVPLGKGQEIAKDMGELLPDYDVSSLQLDEQGLQVKSK